jgi:hypothetical protein
MAWQLLISSPTIVSKMYAFQSGHHSEASSAARVQLLILSMLALHDLASGMCCTMPLHLLRGASFENDSSNQMMLLLSGGCEACLPMIWSLACFAQC